MEKKIYIYTLTDPNTNEIKYVGKTHQPKIRWLSHIRASKRHNKTEKEKWINGLLKNNQIPIFNIIETCTPENWMEREAYWITYYRATVTNISNGHTKNCIKKEKKNEFELNDSGLRMRKTIYFFPIEKPPMPDDLPIIRAKAKIIFYGLDGIKVLKWK